MGVLNGSPASAELKDAAILGIRGFASESAADSGATVSYRVYKTPDLADIGSAQPVGGERAPGAAAEVEKDAADSKMFYRLKVDIDLE